MPLCTSKTKVQPWRKIVFRKVVQKPLKSFSMEEMTIKFYWLIIGASISLIVGIVSFIIRNAISKNATKETVDAKTDLLEKDYRNRGC